MNAYPTRRALLLACLLLACPALGGRSAAEEPPAVVVAGQRYVEALSAAQRAADVLPFAHRNRFRWTFLPGARVGLTLRQMTETQREAALALVRHGLSETGWTRVEGVFALEAELRRRLAPSTRRRNPGWRDPLGYTVTVFGRPAADTTWGWRIGGHHLSLHVTVKDGRLVAGTPFFFGADPARVGRGPQEGLAPLAAQQRAGFALLAALDEPQRRAAVRSTRPPPGFRLTPQVAPTGVAPSGLSGAAFTLAQRAAFFDVVEAFAAALAAPLREPLLRRARASAPDELAFVWRGTAAPGRDHYFRLHGQSFVIEHWNRGNHVHSVWRDTEDEWGRRTLSGQDG